MAERRSSGRTHSLLCLLAAAAVVLLGLHRPAGAQTSSLEYSIKATYLYKFAPFVEWPPTAFADASSPVNICIVGNDPFGDTLDRLVSGERIGARPIDVHRFATVEENPGCHIMYISGPRTAEILSAVRGSEALTFTDAADDPEAKGIVHFVLRDNRVRFEIDDYAAARNGLTISSKVLSLAVSVRPRA